jgi:hypothetical protein
MPPNNTIGLAGRFANHIIRNLYASFLAETGSVAFVYSYDDEFRQLGIPLYREGMKTYEHTAIIRDEFFCDLLDRQVDFNIFVDWCSAQNPAFATRLFHYFRRSEIQRSVMSANRFRERYNSNNDVFVHVRLGDVAHFNPGYSYYDNAIKLTGATSGFISSDSPDHPIITALAEKYGLKLFNDNEVNSIMFASTCKHIVLSSGTFSWIMGILGFFSDVYAPPKHIVIKWCGDIFDMPGWKAIDV